MATIDECANQWVQHFRGIGANIGDIQLNCAGWKCVLSIWEAEPYHRIAQALGVEEFKVTYDGELFFRTTRIPQGIGGADWSIRLSQSEVPIFTERYGNQYKISPL